MSTVILTEILTRMQQSIETIKFRLESLQENLDNHTISNPKYVSLTHWMAKKLPDALFQAVLTILLAFVIRFILK